MRKDLTRLPFDERNEQDFEELTRKIWGALETIKKSRSIPATQEKLAELVGCTRKTLHNRGWPITELKKIKEERKAKSDNKPKNATAEHRLSSEKHIAREKLLIRQIRNLQEQNGSLFDRVQELEEEKERLTDTVKVLEDEVATLKDEKRKVRRGVRRFKQGSGSRANVISIKAIKKPEGGNRKKR